MFDLVLYLSKLDGPSDQGSTTHVGDEGCSHASQFLFGSALAGVGEVGE